MLHVIIVGKKWKNMPPKIYQNIKKTLLANDNYTQNNSFFSDEITGVSQVSKGLIKLSFELVNAAFYRFHFVK